jgi:hypothetical protein
MKNLIFTVLLVFNVQLNFGQSPHFYLDENGVTIKCENCVAGDTGTVNGILYEAVDRDLLIQRIKERDYLVTLCTSPVTDMSNIFSKVKILTWLGRETYNGTSDAVVSSLDLLPTFAEVAGATLPGRTLDGQSMIPVIETGRMHREKPLVWAFYDAINEHRVAMRTDDWKMLARLKNDTAYLPVIHNLYEGNEVLVKEAELEDFELYNMTEDI